MNVTAFKPDNSAACVTDSFTSTDTLLANGADSADPRSNGLQSQRCFYWWFVEVVVVRLFYELSSEQI
jgi:hypothetical protein